MAPRIPPSFPPSFPRQHAAAATTITISSGSSSRVLSVIDVPASSFVTTQQKPKRRYEKWSIEDENELLAVIADLRLGDMIPPASEILKELCSEGRAFSRHGLDIKELSGKIRRLKKLGRF